MKKYNNFINGKWIDSEAKEIIKDEFEPHLIGRNFISLKKISDELKCPYSVADVTKIKDLI